MRYIISFLVLGFFAWLGFKVAFSAMLPGGSRVVDAGFLSPAYTSVVETLGPGLSGALLLSVGILLSRVFLRNLGNDKGLPVEE